MQRHRFAILARGACLCAALALTGLAACSKPDPEAEAAAAAAAKAAAEEEARAAAIAAMPVAPVRPQPEWQKHIDELEPAIEAWAAAWAAQDVEGYLSHYAPEYAPPGMTRAAWEAQRRSRLTRPSRINVELSDVSRVGTRRGVSGGRSIEVVKVRFHQVYESNTFSDEVDKILEMEYREDGGWKIATETSL